MAEFYSLLAPDIDDADAAVYGRGDWEARFGLAEWSDAVRLERIVCPVDPEHRRGGKRIGDLVIILPSPKIGDFVWTWYGECLMTDRVLNLFRKARFTGFAARPVTVERIKRVPRGGQTVVPVLWELAVTGKGGDPHPDSGIRVFKTCDACNLVRYSSYRNGIIVDEQQWDGSDFFTVNGYPKFTLVTERVKDLIVANGLTNCMLVPSSDLRWPKGLLRPEELHERGRRPSAELVKEIQQTLRRLKQKYEGEMNVGKDPKRE
jgi:hypothetical protein